MVENAPVSGVLRSWLTGAVLAISIVFVFVVFQAARMTELADVRAMDLAQVGRNIAAGKGFTTYFIRPLSLADVPSVDNHPDLIHAPLQPYFMSLLFRVFGASTRTISWSSGLPFLLTLPLVYWIALLAFSRKVAMLSVVILATNAVALTTAVSGTEGALVGFIFTLLCVVLLYHQSHSALRTPLAAVAGVLTAALYLTHTVWLAAFAPVLLVLMLGCPRPQRLANVVAFLVLFALVLLPWFYRLQRLTGNPLHNLSAYELIMGTRTHPGNVIYRTYERVPPRVASFMVSSPREIYERSRDLAINTYPLLFAITGLVIMPFFIVASIVPLGHVGMDRLRLGLYLTTVLVFAGLCLTTADGRLLLPLAPIMTVICAAFFYQLLDLRLRPLSEHLRTRWNTTAVGLLIGLHLFPLVLQLAPGRPMPPITAMAVRRAGQELNALIPQASGREPAPMAVLSDMPWAVAWYANRPAIWLPKDDVSLRRMEQDIGQIRWLVLTPQIADIAGGEQASGWAELWRRAITRAPLTGSWRVRQIFANGNWVLLERVADAASVSTLPAGPSR